MLSDFENLNNECSSDNDTGRNLQDFSDLFENLSECFNEDASLSENSYAFWENLDKKYLYEKTELSGGIVKESITLKSNNNIFQNSDSIFNLERAKNVWHIRESDDSAVISCQKFIIEEYLGKQADFVCELNQDVYSENTGDILEFYGIDTHSEYDADFRLIENAFDAGNRIIVHLNSLSLNSSYNGVYPMWNANHMVEIIGVDKSNPDTLKVIINDPDAEDGCGKAVDYDIFSKAWHMSGNYMLTAERIEE